MSDKKPVVITTEYRGVFFGYVMDDSKAPECIILERARMCVYWSSDIKGVLGLASNGPTESCKITQAVPVLTAWKITAIMDCSAEAVERWESAPWK